MEKVRKMGEGPLAMKEMQNSLAKTSFLAGPSATSPSLADALLFANTLPLIVCPLFHFASE
jgi:hypothetical protein